MTIVLQSKLQARPRHSWMDFLRGLAILLVIIFHSVTILKRVDLPPPLWLKEIADFFGLYRMPN